MEVRDGLPGIWAVVGDDAIAAVEQVFLAGYLDRQIQEFGREAWIGGAEISQRGEMSPWHDKDVDRCLGLEIPKGQGSRRLGDEWGGQFAPGDAAKDAVAVALWCRHASIRSFILGRAIHTALPLRSGSSMPELPEVETVRRSLVEGLVGRVVTGVRVHAFAGVVGEAGIEAFRARVVGRRVVALRRRGKYLLLDLGDGTSLVVHLRMTGRLLLAARSSPPVRFEHLVLELDDGQDLRFADQRKFGRVLHLSADQVAALDRRIGQEPLDPVFSSRALNGLLAGRRGKLKSVLLDQAVIAGLGNIYVDEALHRAGLHPERVAGALTPEEVRRLHRAIRAVLREGLTNRGTTFSSFQNGRGEAGNNQGNLRVYGQGRRGEPCLSCGQPLQLTIVGGRSTHYCARCQPDAGESSDR